MDQAVWLDQAKKQWLNTDFSQIRLEKLPSKSASFGEKAATATELSHDK